MYGYTRWWFTCIWGRFPIFTNIFQMGWFNHPPGIGMHKNPVFFCLKLPTLAHFRPCGCQDEVRSYPSGPFGRIIDGPPRGLWGKHWRLIFFFFFWGGEISRLMFGDRWWWCIHTCVLRFVKSWWYNCIWLKFKRNPGTNKRWALGSLGLSNHHVSSCQHDFLVPSFADPKDPDMS